jgi:hypothetical protein
LLLSWFLWAKVSQFTESNQLGFDCAPVFE